jgi:hypothetical protein
MPLAEVVASAGTELPAQIVCDVPKLNAGVTNALTVTVKVVVAIHCSGVLVGVNV